MAEYSRKVLGELNRLKKNSFKMAQDQALENLGKEFDRWRKKRIGADALEASIEKHKTFRREQLEKHYREDGDPGIPVAEAIARGVLRREDLSADAYNAIEILIDLVNI